MENIAGKRKAKPGPFQPKKAQSDSTATSQAAKKTNGSAIKNAQDGLSSSSLGLLNIPPELRNSICRYAIVSEEPTEVTFKGNRLSGRCHFTMMPALTLVSKQLRRETRRLFFEENEFHIDTEAMQQRGSLPALHAMHQRVGLELQSIHVSYTISRTDGWRIYPLKAEIGLRKVEGGRIAISKQTYAGKCFERSLLFLDPTYIGHVEVCGCRVQRLVQNYNENSSTHHLSDLLHLIEQQGRGCRSDSNSAMPVVENDYSLACEDCPTTPWSLCVLF